MPAKLIFSLKSQAVFIFNKKSLLLTFFTTSIIAEIKEFITLSAKLSIFMQIHRFFFVFNLREKLSIKMVLFLVLTRIEKLEEKNAKKKLHDYPCISSELYPFLHLLISKHL